MFIKIRKKPNQCFKKCCKDKHVDLLLIGEQIKRHYVLIKGFNTFVYDHTFKIKSQFMIFADFQGI